jgi:hypothetical protein
MAVGFPLKTTYANGDVYSASDVNDTNGTINLLTTSTLSYQAGKNFIIGGGMDVWQRGTSFTLAASTFTYTADRWQGYRSAATGCTVTRQATGDTTNLPNIQYALRVARDSGNTSTSIIALGYSMESVNSIPLAGKAVTLSFYARKGANFSAASSGLPVTLRTGTGTDQNGFSGSYTGAATPISQTATLTTTWQRFTYTATLAATITEIGLEFDFTPVGTAGAADYFEVTGVQLELGSYATTFSRAGGTIQGELAACQRYYYRIYPSGVSQYFGSAYGVTTTSSNCIVPFPVTMRTSPTAIEQTGTASDYAVRLSNSAVACSAVPVFNMANTYGAIVEFRTAGSLTAGAAGFVRGEFTTVYLGFSAEL